MTALNLMHVGDAVVIFQDRASYDYEDGVIDALHRKSVVSADGRWALGAMGNGYIRPIAERTFTFLPFDDAVDLIGEQVRRTVEIAAARGDDEPSACIAIAGWSEERGALECWYAQSWDWALAEPYEAVEAQFMLNPPPFRDGRRLELTADDVRLNWSSLGALEFGRRLMELQRRPRPEGAPCDMPEWAWKKTAVGGACDAMIVSKDGVRLVTLAEWGDQIGEGPEVRAARPIGPCEILSAKAPGNVVPLNRAERRRLGRQERRAA